MESTPQVVAPQEGCPDIATKVPPCVIASHLDKILSHVYHSFDIVVSALLSKAAEGPHNVTRHAQTEFVDVDFVHGRVPWTPEEIAHMLMRIFRQNIQHCCILRGGCLRDVLCPQHPRDREIPPSREQDEQECH